MTDSRIPGPAGGISLQDARLLQQNTLAYLSRVSADYGDAIKIRIGFWDVYLFSHPDAVRHILLDNWRNYSRDTFQFKQFGRVTGSGLLTSTDETWQRHRRLMQPAFHRRHLAGIAEGINRAVDRLIGRWNHQIGRSGEAIIDVDQALLRLALEVIGESLFSLDLTDQAADLSQELLHLMAYVIYRSQNMLALPEWVPSGRNRRFQQRMRRLDTLVGDLIAARRVAPPQEDLLGMLLGADPDNALSDRAIRDELVTMIIAGYETVASGMGWIFKTLIDHPQLIRKLRLELSSIPFNADGVARAPLLNGVIQETFRLYPPSWLITRRSITADEVVGYSLPAGALVVVSPFLVHRHPDFWPDPETFNPSRFTSDNGPAHPFAHIPFGGGPHLCIGKPLAMLEASLTLAGLLTYFNFSRPPALGKVTPNPQVTLRPYPDLKMLIRRVRSGE